MNTSGINHKEADMNIFKKTAVRVVAIILVAATAITLTISFLLFKRDKLSSSGTAYVDFGCLLEEGMK